MISKKDIIETIALLKVTYPSALKELGENELKMMIEVWYADFKDTKKEDFKNAIEAIRNTSSFFPSIADIKNKIAKAHLKDHPDANEEWAKVINAVHVYGSYREEEALNSLNPYTAKIVKLIGYYRICTATKEEQVWNKKEFIEEYNSLTDKITENLQIGITEGNVLNG